MALITDYWSLDGIIILTILIIIAYLYMTRKFKYWKNQGILQITPTPFFGNFKECLFLKKAPAYFLKDLYEQTKEPYMGFYVLDKPFLLIRDRELIKNVLIKDFSYFADRYMISDPNDRIGYANLFFIKNPTWKIIRTKLTPFFTSGKMKKMFDLMLICVKNLDEHLDSLQLDGNGKTIEVRDLTARFTTDIIGSTAYGLDVNSFKDPDAEFRKYGKMIFQYDMIRGLEMLAIFFLPTVVRLARIKLFGREPTKFLRKIFWETLSERMKSGVKRNDLIDILIELKNNNNDQNFTDFSFDGDDLLAQAASFFSAGFETSSTSSVFAMYELAIQPEIQNALRKEILEALEKSNGKITYDMIWSLPYLDMVVSETLRMYPPLGYLNRMAMQTYKVPEYDLVIEKGMPVYIPMLGLHYDPEYFPNPNKFDPERFNEENKRNRPPCVYFPFGEGPHVCIGNRFGLLQIKLILFKILSKYEVTPCKETSIPVEIDPRGAMTVPLNKSMRDKREAKCCKQCDFVASTKMEYWEHMREHIKGFTCSECSCVTKYKHHMNHHWLSVHDGSKPFECKKCSYACVSKSMLTSHLKKYSNVYPYGCADCTYRTKFCNALKKHLRKKEHRPAISVLDADADADGPKPPSKNQRVSKYSRLDSSSSIARYSTVINSETNDVATEFPYGDLIAAFNLSNHVPLRVEDANMIEYSAETHSEKFTPRRPNEEKPEELEKQVGGADTKQLVCRYCEIIFGNVIMYVVHMGCHSFDDPYACNICGHRCTDKLSFFLHIARSEH